MTIIKKEDLIAILENVNRMTNVYTFTKDFVGEGIVECQNLYYEGKSKYSHVMFIGNDGNVYESTVNFKIINIEKKFLGIKIKVPQIKWVYGIKITEISERFASWTEYDRFAVQTLPAITSEQWQKVTEAGRKMKDEKFKYAVGELFGTLWILLKYKLTQDPEKKKKILQEKNPFGGAKDIYCVSFVATCIKEATGINFIEGRSLNLDDALVDDGIFTKLPNILNIYECENK